MIQVLLDILHRSINGVPLRPLSTYLGPEYNWWEIPVLFGVFIALLLINLVLYWKNGV